MDAQCDTLGKLWEDLHVGHAFQNTRRQSTLASFNTIRLSRWGVYPTMRGHVSDQSCATSSKIAAPRPTEMLSSAASTFGSNIVMWVHMVVTVGLDFEHHWCSNSSHSSIVARSVEDYTTATFSESTHCSGSSVAHVRASLCYCSNILPHFLHFLCIVVWIFALFATLIAT